MGQIKLKLGGVPEHFNLLWEMDGIRKIFAENGVAYDFFEFPGGTGAMSEAVKSSFLDGAVILTEGAVSEISRGTNYKIVCPFVESPLFWGIFASTKHPITDVSNLRERKFAISRFNSGSHLMAQYLAFQNGVSLSPENFYPANDLEGARLALAEGNADLFLWEKYMTNPLVENGEFRKVGEVTAPWNSFVLVLRTDVAEQHNELVYNLRNAVKKAGTAFKELDNAPRLIADRYHISFADATEWFGQVRYGKGNHSFHAGIDKTAELLKQFSITSRIPSRDELCYA